MQNTSFLCRKSPLDVLSNRCTVQFLSTLRMPVGEVTCLLCFAWVPGSCHWCVGVFWRVALLLNPMVCCCWQGKGLCPVIRPQPCVLPRCSTDVAVAVVSITPGHSASGTVSWHWQHWELSLGKDHCCSLNVGSCSPGSQCLERGRRADLSVCHTATGRTTKWCLFCLWLFFSCLFILFMWGLCCHLPHTDCLLPSLYPWGSVCLI